MPAEEIALAVKKVVNDSCGISEDEASDRAGRLLGFPRVTDEVRERVQGVTRQLLADNQLIAQGSHVFMSDEESRY